MRKTVYILLGFTTVLMISSFLFLKDIEEEEPVVVLAQTIDPPGPEDSLITKYDSYISRTIDSLNTVGAAVAITYKGEIIYQKCFGVKKAGGYEPIDENTVFRLASVSKTVTGILAGILSQDSIIPLDTKVVEHIPGFRLKDSVNTAELNIRHILSHTSGLVPHAYDNLVEAKIPMSVIIDSLKRVNISARPGVYYGYQNVVFSLYDTLVSTITGKQFPALLNEKLFEPFGMTDASAGMHGFSSTTNIAYPHYRSGSSYRVLPLNDRYYNTNPAAGINASISDMASFLLAISSENDLIDQNTLDTVFAPRIKTPLKWNYFRRWDRINSKHYGLGWRIIKYKEMDIAYHGGYVQGYRTEIAVCRDEEIGIVFLSNSPNAASALSIPTFLNLFAEMKSHEVEHIMATPGP